MSTLDTVDTTAPLQEGCYLYCIAPAFDLSGLNMRGLDNANVYQITFKDIGAVVHDCPAVPYAGESEQAKAWLLAHHAIIDTVWGQAGATLPVTFDVIIKGDSGEQARAQVVAWLKENYKSFHDKLDSLQGKTELVIQVSWDRAAALQEIVSTDSEVKQLQDELQGKPRGMAFFYKQKIEKLIKQKADAIVEDLCQGYLQSIQALSIQTFINKPKHSDGLEMLLNLSVLADKEKVSDIGDVLGDLDARGGFSIRFTGPWPPYSFAMTSQDCERTDGGENADCLERGEEMEEQKDGGDIVAAILRLASKLESDGRPREACELYFKILDSAAETDAAAKAKRALMAIAYGYERKGLVHMALDLYEKLR